MNWLAHVLLSKQNIDFQLGNYLADPLKGQFWQGASADLIEGMRIHKIIDSYTDRDPIVSQSKARLRKRGLLKPVIIDLTYDYLLTQNWDSFTSINKSTFLKHFNHDGYQRAFAFPQEPQQLVHNLTQNDRLNRYNTFEELYHGFKRIDERLSPKLLAKESASGYFEDVLNHIESLEADFLAFFPQLCEHIKQYPGLEDITHLK